MYTWGYIKEATLVELDMPIKTATENGIINKFPFFANTIMTQICSAIKPQWTSIDFKVRDKQKLIRELVLKYDVEYFNEFSDMKELQLRKNGVLDLTFLDTTSCQEEDLNYIQLKFLKEYQSHIFLNEPVNMPADFISFDIVPTTVVRSSGKIEEAYDTDYLTSEYNSVTFFTEGVFTVPYRARWFTFLPTTDDKEVLQIPLDIADCLPLYIASQCLKVDDEQKSAILRNELELALARIDNTRLVQNKTIKIEGDW